jgi:hypothetical protein
LGYSLKGEMLEVLCSFESRVLFSKLGFIVKSGWHHPDREDNQNIKKDTGTMAKRDLSTVLSQTNIDITLNLNLISTKKYQTIIFFKEIIKIIKSSRSTPGVNLIILTPANRNHPLIPNTLTKC